MLQAHGVTEQQWRILRALLEDASLEPRQLCEKCLISSPSIAGVLMRMEEAGLIAKERMDHDHRRVNVTLTVRAKKLCKKLAPVIDAKYEEIEALIGVKQLQSFYDALDDLSQHLEP